MKTSRTTRRSRKKTGIALLISIFILLLICVVAIALIVSSGTETALAGNYRSSTGVYYAAYAGLEEARGRLSPKDPNTFKSVWSSTFYSGTPAPIDTFGYVLNPGPGETAGAILTTYPDTEYTQEFPSGPYTTITTPSVWNMGPLNTLSFPGPLYKWVRINAVSEKSLNVDADADNQADSTTPLYYDGAHFSNNSSAGPQVLELTAFAILPNGSQKILQYIVAPTPLTMPPFLAALTLAGSSGSGATFHPPNTNGSYVVRGDNYDCSGNPVVGGKVHAVGVFTDTDKANAITAIPNITYTPTGSPATVPQNYTGSGSAPDVSNIGSSFSLTPAQLDGIAQTIIQNADAVVPAGSASTQTAFLTSLGMSPTNVLTVVATDLDVSNWSRTGYGLLVVTGTFTYDPDTTWNGIVLVVGKGMVTNIQNGQYKYINGAMIVAKTRDNLGNILSSYGPASMSFNNGMQGYGVNYSSCWISNSIPSGSYKILSFHEIASQ